MDMRQGPPFPAAGPEMRTTLRPTPAPHVWPYPGRTVAEVWAAEHTARRDADRRALDCAFGVR